MSSTPFQVTEYAVQEYAGNWGSLLLIPTVDITGQDLDVGGTETWHCDALSELVQQHTSS